MTSHRRPIRTLVPLLLAVGVLATTATPASAVPGTRLWASRYDSAAHKADEPSSLAVSPDGSTVFVTGTSRRWPAPAFATIAYDAASGETVWQRTFRGPGFGARANDIALSHDGHVVIVAGDTESSATGLDVRIVAYDAATGETLWTRRYVAGGSESAVSIVVSHTSDTFVVTGFGTDPEENSAFLTIAYDFDAAKATKRWVRRYDGNGGGAFEAAMSPDGSGVFVLGDGHGGDERGFDYLTIGYDTATGARRWVRRFDGWAGGDDFGSGLAVSSSTVFVTGESPRGNGVDDYATVAYAVATGTRRWVARYDGPGASFDLASGVAVSPDGARVFVTGDSRGLDGEYDIGTIAYDATDGAQVWESRYDADHASAIAVNPDGTEVFVTGISSFTAATSIDFITLAIDAATGGTPAWARRYDGPASGFDEAVAIAVSLVGSKVFVTGPSWDAAMVNDYATVAYATS